MIGQDELSVRWQTTCNYRSETEPLLTEIASLFLPRAGNFYDSDITGQNRYSHIYDNTGLKLISDGAKEIVSSLMPKGSDWATIEIVEGIKDKLSPTARYNAERIAEMASSEFMNQVGLTNLRYAAKTCAEQWLAFGTAAMFPKFSQLKKKLHFHVIPSDRFYLEPLGDEPETPGIFWRRVCTAQELRNNYGWTGDANRSTDKFNCVYAFVADRNGQYWQVLFSEGRNQGIHGSSGRGASTSVTEIIYQNPYRPGRQGAVVGSMNQSAGETYGNGLGHKLLSEVRNQQVIREHMIIAMAYEANPIFVANGMIEPGRTGIRPGAIINTDQPFGKDNMPIVPLQTGGNAMASLKAVEEARQQVRQLTDQMPPPYEVPQGRTATEILVAKQMRDSSIVDMVDGFADSILRPVLEEAFYLLQEGDGTIPPDMTVDGKIFSVNVVADQQRNRKLINLQKIQALMETLGQMPPEMVAMNVNFAKLIQKVGFETDLTELMNSPEEAQQVYSAMQEQMQQQQAAGEAQQAEVETIQ